MNKILLSLAILGAGTAGALTARHSTMKLQREANTARESWILTGQVLADAQSERERLAERIRELRQRLRQAKAAGSQNGLWSVPETNRIGHFAPELREHLLEELGFSWDASEAFIVVSKETVHFIRNNQTVLGRHGKLNDSVAALLALTPQERSQIEAAIERVQMDLKDWAVSHTERTEPGDDVLAQYTLQSAPPMSITNHFTEVFSAIGKERTERIMIGSWQDRINGSIAKWMGDIGLSDKPVTMILKRFSEANRQLVKARVFTPDSAKPGEAGAERWYEISNRNFPGAFRPLFPNGWADVAEREGFEIPIELLKK
jgi:hypothetical protein